MDLAEFQKNEAVATAKREAKKVDKAERQEKELAARVAELEGLVLGQEELKRWVAALENHLEEQRKTGERRLQEAIELKKTWWECFIPVFVRRLFQTRGFATMFAKIAELAIRFERHQAAVAVREVYPHIPKVHVRGLDRAAVARLNYNYADMVQRMEESFPLVDHLLTMPEVPTVEYLEGYAVDRLDQVLELAVEPLANPCRAI